MANWVTREVFNDFYCRSDPIAQNTWRTMCRDGAFKPIARKLGGVWRVDIDRLNPETLGSVSAEAERAAKDMGPYED